MDRIVGEYLQLTSALPHSNMAPEGLHSTRLSDYETPINIQATVMVGTPIKLLNAVKQQQIDVSAVDVIILHNAQSLAKARTESASILELHSTVVSHKHSPPQVVAFTDTEGLVPVTELVSGITPTAEVITAQ